jgi:tRNA(Ile2) C34 agmatinyltransferase TiaS
MIYVGIDDTDMPDTPGTNQLARALIAHVAGGYRCRMVLRHQLLDDPRVPYTSKNGSASLQFDLIGDGKPDLPEVIDALRTRMLEWYIPGSDPGLCVTTAVPDEVIAFGRRCQRELVTHSDAVALAERTGLHLEGLGGTCGGMIGALAAVGLAAGRDDGRVVVNGVWPDDLSGRQPIALLHDRGVRVRTLENQAEIETGVVDVGKHLRPNLREGRIVQFVRPAEIVGEWQAVRLT